MTVTDDESMICPLVDLGGPQAETIFFFGTNRLGDCQIKRKSFSESWQHAPLLIASPKESPTQPLECSQKRGMVSLGAGSMISFADFSLQSIGFKGPEKRQLSLFGQPVEVLAPTTRGHLMMTIVAFFLCCGGIEAIGQTEEREWIDDSGKFRVKATFLKISDGNVFLKRADGKEIEVPMDRLSQESIFAAKSAEAVLAKKDAEQNKRNFLNFQKPRTKKNNSKSNPPETETSPASTSPESLKEKKIKFLQNPDQDGGFINGRVVDGILHKEILLFPEKHLYRAVSWTVDSAKVVKLGENFCLDFHRYDEWFNPTFRNTVPFFISPGLAEKLVSLGASATSRPAFFEIYFLFKKTADGKSYAGYIYGFSYYDKSQNLFNTQRTGFTDFDWVIE